MANPFYTYSGAFIPGTLARAEQVGVEYSSVQAGFALLAIQGIDSGSANTYVVTLTVRRSLTMPMETSSNSRLRTPALAPVR
jgi:hypothetical protein